MRKASGPRGLWNDGVGLPWRACARSISDDNLRVLEGAPVSTTGGPLNTGSPAPRQTCGSQTSVEVARNLHFNNSQVIPVHIAGCHSGTPASVSAKGQSQEMPTATFAERGKVPGHLCMTRSLVSPSLA